MDSLPRASHWVSAGDAVRCDLCVHNCRIKPGKTGTCGVRRNERGTLVLPYYGAISSTAIDPIEKKPLYHFHPGREVFSVGFLGCNLRCPFCQNYSISQDTSRATRRLTPGQIVDEARASGSTLIAYTYNEPTIHFEFVKDCAVLAHARGLQNVLVTNGHLQDSPARDLMQHIDGANVDLKSFDPAAYRRDLGGDLETVRTFIAVAHELSHVEVTTLLVPGFNDSPAEIRSIAEFVASVDSRIPLHISAYYPAYRYTAPATSHTEVSRTVTLARDCLQYVYAGNVGGRTDTVCPSCGTTLVRRTGYAVEIAGITSGRCTGCGAETDIRLS